MISRSSEGIVIQTGVMLKPELAWDPKMFGDIYTIYGYRGCGQTELSQK